MSKIITDWVCEHCGHTKNEYVSFGHPEQSFIYRWKCEKCGGENSCEIEEWISSRGPQNEVTIYRGDPTTMFRIFRTDCGEELIAIPSSQFDWKDFEDEEMAECLDQYLTLEDISDQLKDKAKSEKIGVIYVWVESPLYGAIYLYGNYIGDTSWYLHGKTNGYA